jgi:hypothetical protein
VDEPPEDSKPLTTGELLTRLAPDWRGVVGTKLNLSGLNIAGAGLAALRLDLAGLAAYPGLASVKLDFAGLAGTSAGLSLGEAFGAQWRGQLADADARIQGTVAGQMSKVLAGMRLPAVGLAGLDLDLVAGGIGSPLAASIGAIAKSFGAGLAASIKPLALLAVRGFSEIWRDYDERRRQAEQALYEMGWWLPQSVMMDWAVRVEDFALAGDKLAVRHEMNEASHSREFARVVTRDWMRWPVFAERRRFFLDALADHRRGR